MTSDPIEAHPLLRYLLVALASLLTLGLFIWSIANYHLQLTQPIFYGSRAIYSIILLCLIVGLFGQILLLRILKAEIGPLSAKEAQRNITWRLLLLFDVAAPIYLAAGVLLGIFAAVLTALVTQLIVQGYTSWRGLASWTASVYRIATTGVLVLLSTTVFQRVSAIFRATSHAGTSYLESWELIGTVLAACVMMVFLMIVALPVIMRVQHISLRAALGEYFRSSLPFFQLLVLSVAPLLPVVDIFDNVVAELAWIFFLVPLLAIYSLALVSVRLSLRTDELRKTLKDLSSARRRQGELRDYASLVTRVQEEERRRLARELHDDTAQALIALARGLDGLERAIEQLDPPRRDREWLANLQALAARTLDGVRRACRDLRPSILDDLGLRAALEWLCDSSSSRGVTSSFVCTGTVYVLLPEAEIAIFRIAQEALSNVWRHAHATCVDVELEYLPTSLCLRVRDNGQGFSLDDLPDGHQDSSSGLGLLGMRERALLIDATLKISSLPDCGCNIVLTLPLPLAEK